ncbi:MAG TPA: class I SAM-dependent methyltransferase [Stellaceae bacterium]|nr:class I SAM-dependent methyltransferase [Stellaceae bacterium]
MNQPAASSFFDRYESFIRKAATAAGSGSDLANPGRLRQRYTALIGGNRDLFRGARVLDPMSSLGLWSLAALDAGAAHVVGVENREKAVESANALFSEAGVAPGSYRFVNSDLFAAVRGFEPGEFDLVLSHGFLERSDPRFFFQQMARLRVKHVILDTRIVRGKGPIVRLMKRGDDNEKAGPAARYAAMLSLPNHELITFFCDYFKFSWRHVDLKALGIVDFKDIADYQNDRRRIYVLEANPSAGGQGRRRVGAAKRN